MRGLAQIAGDRLTERPALRRGPYGLPIMSVDLAERAQMRRAWTTLAAVGFTNLQMAMALSMVFVVFPDLEDSFPDSSSATLSWAVNIFTIVGAATLVIGASLARRWGARQGLLAGTGLFTLASVAAAVSPNVELLVLCRVVQALGSSLIIPSGAAIVYREFPLHKRGIAVTTWAAIGAVGAAAGPSLGGLLIDVGSWRWAFWLNLPLGIVALAVVAVVIGDTPADRSVRMPDAASSVLLTVGIGAAVLALVQTPEWGWSDERTLASMVVGLALLAVVVRRSFHHPRPLLELSLFRDARFGVGNIALLVFSVSFFGFLLTSVLFLTDVWGYSIRRAGLAHDPGLRRDRGDVGRIGSSGRAHRLSHRDGGGRCAVGRRHALDGARHDRVAVTAVGGSARSRRSVWVQGCCGGRCSR